jgi:hypothetical protein
VAGMGRVVGFGAADFWGARREMVPKLVFCFTSQKVVFAIFMENSDEWEASKAFSLPRHPSPHVNTMSQPNSNFTGKSLD